MMKKIIILLGFVIFLASCNPSTTDPSFIYRGTEGISIGFGTNTPPETIYEDTRILVGFDVFNRGAYSVIDEEYAVITLRYDNLYFSSDRDPVFEGDRVRRTSFNLLGKQPGYPDGDRDFIDLGYLNVNEIQGNRDSVTTRLTANVCYPYKTMLTEIICVDTDVFEGVSDPVCRNRGAHTYSSQGAPIAISKIEPRMVPRGSVRGEQDTFTSVVDPETGQFLGIEEVSSETELFIIQPTFEIEVRNAGRGTVFYESSDASPGDACIGFESERELNQVKVKATLGSQELDCNPEIINLRNDRGVTRCSIPEEELSATIGSYTQVINVEAEYYYSDHISKTIEIRSIN